MVVVTAVVMLVWMAEVLLTVDGVVSSIGAVGVVHRGGGGDGGGGGAIPSGSGTEV